MRPAVIARPDGRPRVLVVVHATLNAEVVGGTEFHVRHLIAALGDRYRFLVLYGLDGEWLVLDDVERLSGGRFERRAYDMALQETGVQDWMARLLADFGVALVHVHHMWRHELGPMFAALQAFAGPKLYTVHDYHVVCPNLNLLDHHGRFCGLPTESAACAPCIGETQGWPMARLEAYRASYRDALRTFDRVIFPSESVKRTLAVPLGLTEAQTRVIEHGSDVAPPDAPAIAYTGGTLRVAFIGALVPHKGIATLHRLVELNGCDDVEWHVWGFPYQPIAKPRHGRVIYHGPYRQPEIGRLLREAGIHVGLLPAICAETFSFTLSELFAAGLPVIGSSLGAIGDRLRDRRAGWVVAPDDLEGMLAVIARLHADPAEWARVVAAADFSVRSIDAMAETYRAMYASLDWTPPAAPPGASERWAEPVRRADERTAIRLRHDTLVDEARQRLPGAWWTMAERVARLAVFRLAPFAPRALKNAVRRAWLTIRL